MFQGAHDVFISYSHDDDDLRKELEEHLALLRREGRVRTWSDRQIGAGEEWRGQIDEKLEAADVVILLVSSSFIASDYCWDVETTRALERHAQGKTRVVPVVVRPCDWETAPFAEVQALPRDAAVTEAENRDAGWREVVKGLREAIDAFEAVEAEGDDLTQRLKELYRQRKELTLVGGDTRALESKILDVRRLIRRGPRLDPGDFLADGRYELQKVLGQGGFATVWQAWDTDAEQAVAVKVLHPHHGGDQSKRERFFRGARQMAKLAHPHVVRVLASEVEDEGWHFFVMEHMDGGNFEQAVLLSGRLSLARRLRVVLEVGEALAYAHRQGVVHRDVKPANVLLAADGTAKLADFDLVRADDTTGLTATQAMMGTVLFASPESLERAAAVTAAADVYSLGATAVFAVAGERLPAWFYRDPERAVAELGCGEEMRRVLGRAMAFEVRERYSSVEEFCSELAGSISSEPDEETTGGVVEEKPATEPIIPAAVDADEESRDEEGGPPKRWLVRVAALAVAVTAVVASWDALTSSLDKPVAEEPAVALSPPVPVLQPEPGAHEAGAPWDGHFGIKLRYVPAGDDYQIGTPETPETEPWRDFDETLHTVKLTRPFLIAETEVTQGLWKEVMGDTPNPSLFTACGDDCPVERVSWFEAAEFANRLSEKAGLDRCYEISGCAGTLGGGCVDGDWCIGDYTCEVQFLGLKCEGYRLPTEAEWEVAARAGEPGPIYTGKLTIEGANNASELDEIAWYGGNSGVEYSGGYDCSGWSEKQHPSDRCGTHPVSDGAKRPNDWGLHHMLGNVWEWTWDWNASYDTDAVDPMGPESGSIRVIRGGSWIANARYCRSAYRGANDPGRRCAFVGFRLARTP